ncbi:MAG TPA: hypothetical protein VMH61_02215 [Candidatus Acidoferrales bacterium]|nr:hypothetical protein [Candidatus Acidoferrales bacterium]
MGERPLALGVLGAMLMVALGACVALGKPWANWAPAPLASDSSYAALAARPRDSLDVGQLEWVQVQEQWRAARAKEAGESSRVFGGLQYPHQARPTDRRFAELASRPYAELSERELSWLVLESANQRQGANGGATVALGVIAVAALAGTIALWVTLSHPLQIW